MSHVVSRTANCPSLLGPLAASGSPRGGPRQEERRFLEELQKASRRDSRDREEFLDSPAICEVPAFFGYFSSSSNVTEN